MRPDSRLLRILILGNLVMALGLGCAPATRTLAPAPAASQATVTLTPTATAIPPTPTATATPTPAPTATAKSVPVAAATATPTATAVPLAPAAAPAPRPAAPQEVRIDVVDYAFSPTEVTVPVGTKVTWTMHDPVPHTVTIKVPTSQVAFDQTLGGHGETFSFTFNTPGVFDYVCTLHGMPGTIIVRQ